MNEIFSTLYRDFSQLVCRRRFWIFCSAWAFICSILYFSYLEEFLNIQATLRAKNFRHGVTELTIVPYIKTAGYASIIFIASLCARLYYNEHFAAFSAIFRTTTHSKIKLITAKYCYIMCLSFYATLIIYLPILGSSFFFDYNQTRTLLLVFGLFTLFIFTGSISAVFSQIISNSIFVVLLTSSIIILPELCTTLIVDPAWLNPVFAFFSPISHMNNIASGILSVSDIIFFVFLLGLTTTLFSRQFSNTFLLTR
ncbi:MAG: hypothetical protein KGV50_06960 [Gammaproteobacteria bacterium]|nr:hypothetical protein [Gammaproteobacteria bacterium]